MSLKEKLYRIKADPLKEIKECFREYLEPIKEYFEKRKRYQEEIREYQEWSDRSFREMIKKNLEEAPTHADQVEMKSMSIPRIKNLPRRE